ncbi:unnamed protein product, partial [Urochloa humidicola]
ASKSYVINAVECNNMPAGFLQLDSSKNEAAADAARQ